MTAEQIIPPTDPETKACWYQPHRRFIEMDDTSALMTEQTFRELIDHTDARPPVARVGKMWKMKFGGKWHLWWFSESKNPALLDIHSREILIL